MSDSEHPVMDNAEQRPIKEAHYEYAHCNTCRKTTQWSKIGKKSTCNGCRGVFPCNHACHHVDCKLERKEMVEHSCHRILDLNSECPCGKKEEAACQPST